MFLLKLTTKLFLKKKCHKLGENSNLSIFRESNSYLWYDQMKFNKAILILTILVWDKIIATITV